MRDKVLTLLNIMTEGFQDVSPCSLVDGYEHFGGKYCCSLQIGVLFVPASVIDFAVCVLSTIIDFFYRNVEPLITLL
jgi:hypothetical protein